MTWKRLKTNAERQPYQLTYQDLQTLILKELGVFYPQATTLFLTTMIVNLPYLHRLYLKL